MRRCSVAIWPVIATVSPQPLQLRSCHSASRPITVAGGRRSADGDRAALALREFDDDIARSLPSVASSGGVIVEAHGGGGEQAGLGETAAEFVEALRRDALAFLPRTQVRDELFLGSPSPETESLPNDARRPGRRRNSISIVPVLASASASTGSAFASG